MTDAARVALSFWPSPCSFLSFLSFPFPLYFCLSVDTQLSHYWWSLGHGPPNSVMLHWPNVVNPLRYSLILARNGQHGLMVSQTLWSRQGFLKVQYVCVSVCALLTWHSWHWQWGEPEKPSACGHLLGVYLKSNLIVCFRPMQNLQTWLHCLIWSVFLGLNYASISLHYLDKKSVVRLCLQHVPTNDGLMSCQIRGTFMRSCQPLPLLCNPCPFCFTQGFIEAPLLHHARRALGVVWGYHTTYFGAAFTPFSQHAQWVYANISEPIPWGEC